MHWFEYLALFGIGCLAGTLNVVAGGGSFITLPILIFFGLPAVVANGTNRIGILLQNVGAVWSFNRHRLIPWRSLYWAALPATGGAILGTILALGVSDSAFRKILAFLMVALTFWSLWNPLRGRFSFPDGGRRRVVLLGLAFFLVGIYGGFVQAGVGFFFLAVTSMAGLDLVRGNALKVLTILFFTVFSLAIFAWQASVDWPAGLALAAGTVLGGQMGVRLAVLKGHNWIRAVVTITLIIFALKLWLGG